MPRPPRLTDYVLAGYADHAERTQGRCPPGAESAPEVQAYWSGWRSGAMDELARLARRARAALDISQPRGVNHG